MGDVEVNGVGSLKITLGDSKGGVYGINTRYDVTLNSGTIDMPIGRDKKDRQKMAVVKDGKPATTHFQVVERFKDHTLVKCQLVSGRTHQIRVHMSAIGHPVEGDPLYCGRNYDKIYKNGQLLTAYKLKLIHPTSKKEMVFEIELPDYFKEVLAKL